MTRRAFRPLQQPTGSPTLEETKRRKPSRRIFKKLSGYAFEPPIPYFGRIYRTMFPTAIADYESLSGANWTSGTSGNAGTIANSSWNCLYHHYQTTNRRSVPYSVIMQPIRWTIDAPAATGGVYDWYGRSSTSASERRMYFGTGQNVLTSQYGLGALAIHDRLLTSGTGHCDFVDNTVTVDVVTMPITASSPNGNLIFNYANFQAIAPTIPVWGNGNVEIAYMRHRRNGAAVGSLIENPIMGIQSGGKWDVSPFAKNDSYSVDIWYRVYSTESSNEAIGPAKQICMIPLTRVSTGSRWTDVGPIRFMPIWTFRNVDMSTAFNYKTQTFAVTLNGHSGWTLKDGSNGPHAMKTDGLWIGGANSQQAVLTAPSPAGWVKSITLRWDREIAHCELELGDQLKAALGGSASLPVKFYYRPASDGSYRSGVTSTDWGTVTSSPCGLFNQGGTTTFNLILNSIEANISGVFAGGLDGRRSGGLTPSPLPEVPTSITVSRVDL